MIVLNNLKRKNEPVELKKVVRSLGMQSFFSTLLSLACLLLTPSVLAQKPAIAPAPTPAAVDSTKLLRSAADSIPPAVQRNGIRVGNSILTPDNATVLDQPDTTQVTPQQEAKIRKIIPRKAAMRSLMFPGLGQIYNRQYWKLIFVYGGLGAAVYAFQFNQRNFLRYEAAYKEAYSMPAINPLYNAKGTTIDDRWLSVTTLQQASNQYHQWRDLTIIATAAGWALNIVEASVAAHMKTFDLTDDISLRIKPNGFVMPGVGIAPGVQMAFIFK